MGSDSFPIRFTHTKGLFRGALDPLFFEMATELAFALGVPAGTAGTLLALGLHVVRLFISQKKWHLPV